MYVRWLSTDALMASLLVNSGSFSPTIFATTAHLWLQSCPDRDFGFDVRVLPIRSGGSNGSLGW